MKYFLLIVEGDITPIVFGPFKTAAARDERAVIEKRRRGDKDGIFRMQVRRDRPEVVPYMAYQLKASGDPQPAPAICAPDCLGYVPPVQPEKLPLADRIGTDTEARISRTPAKKAAPRKVRR